ncbi:hypothetical protein AZI11_13280 (plasmid) [Levilactobacillus brevis]|uniref:hypothetical protein n=1 Tax=Levilactobacillus brevis TaxID=1580 RepID=UPI000A205993|nr:hypothetical protein [Levilactobacillus brevis]ARN93904.1 hypothetical protein AZI11_13280 [Levilactobacillus brevis]ARN96441.1 hypothetical protein AZI12_13155 [Levilactobacillus brevis]
MQAFKKIWKVKITSFWTYILIILVTLLTYDYLKHLLPIFANFWLGLVLFLAIYYILFIGAKIVLLERHK